MSERDYTEAALAVIALGAVLAGLVYGRSFLIPLCPAAWWVRSIRLSAISPSSLGPNSRRN